MSGARRRTGTERPDRARAASLLAVVVPLSLAATVVLQAAEPQLGIIEQDDLREGQLEAAGAVAMTLIGGVLLGRVRRDRSRRSLLLGTALLVLAAASLVASIATPLADSLSRSIVATWTVAGGSVLGALLLMAASFLREHSVPQGGVAAALTAAAAGLALALIAVGAAALDGWLPAPFERLPTAAEDITAVDEHPALLAVELFTAAGFGAAAWRVAIVADSEADELSRWLSVAFALASIAYVNYALVPSQFTELVYTGDLFFLLAIAVLIWGAIMEITSTEAALVRWAVSSERTRVADELRAGIAQELAFMASQTELFARSPERRHPLDELAASVERALDESRGAIAELVRPVDEPVDVAVGEVAREVAAGVGASVELDLAEDVDVNRHSRDVLVRLTRECVILATRHRGARALAVQLRGGRRITLRVVDDGRPAEPGDLSLQALLERAETIGAKATCSPSPGRGTVIEIELR